MLKPNQTTEIIVLDCPEPPGSSLVSDFQPKRTNTHTVVISARLFDKKNGEILSRASNWPEPYRFINFCDPKLKFKVDGDAVQVTVGKPVKGVFFSVEGDENVKWSDNNLDVFPGDAQTIVGKGLSGRSIKVAWMGHENAKEI